MEVDALLSRYKEGVLPKERFVVYLSAVIPKDLMTRDMLISLINDYDAGIISEDEFIAFTYGDVESMLGWYKEGILPKDRFITYFPAMVPRDFLIGLIDDYDAHVITDTSFLAIVSGMMPELPPPPIDLLEEWEKFALSKKAKKRLPSYYDRIRPFLVWLTEKRIPVTNRSPTESYLLDYISDREIVRGVYDELRTKYRIRRKDEMPVIRAATFNYIIHHDIGKLGTILETELKAIDSDLDPREIAGEIITIVETPPREITKFSDAFRKSLINENKTFFNWLVHISKPRGLTVNPLEDVEAEDYKTRIETFDIEVEHGKLIHSEMNPIYEALYTHPDRFEDWRLVELEIRLMRETGLRVEHARLIHFGDIFLNVKSYAGWSCGGIVTYDRIKPEELAPKFLPKISTPISPLFAKRIETYLELFKPSMDAPIFYQKGSTGFLDKMHKLRGWADIPYANKVLPKTFRKAFATLLCNIEVKDYAIWEQLTGDSITTLRKRYARGDLRAEYAAMGLHSYADVLNIIFASEGLLEEEIAPKRPVGRPRRKQAFILPEYE